MPEFDDEVKKPARLVMIGLVVVFLSGWLGAIVSGEYLRSLSLWRSCLWGLFLSLLLALPLVIVLALIPQRYATPFLAILGGVVFLLSLGLSMWLTLLGGAAC
jgi:glycopeptide antibiotics resistance protein